MSVCPLTARAPDLRDDYKEMSKSIKQAKNAEGMLKMIDEKTPLNLDEFDEIPYDPCDFGGEYIKKSREQQKREGRNIDDSPIIFKDDY